MPDKFRLRNPSDFIPGLELNHGFYQEIVAPLLQQHFPALQYAAALTGHGSDVLGYDDYQSTDHVWGPRLQLFLRQADLEQIGEKLNDFFSHNLPFVYRGFPTHFIPLEGWFRQACLAGTAAYPINHFIEIVSVEGFFRRDIAFTLHQPPDFRQWLAYPVQHLLELTGGEVFHDAPGELTAAREQLRFFPVEVLLMKLYILWKAIAEEQAFTGRCRERDDTLGFNLILSRQVNRIMKLAFFYDKQYYPYSKWFGLAFRKLPAAKELLPHLKEILESTHLPDQETALANAFLALAGRHNAAGLTLEVELKIEEYYQRKYFGFNAETVVEKLSRQLNWTKLGDIDLLAKTVLEDDSNVGSSYAANARLVELALG